MAEGINFVSAVTGSEWEPIASAGIAALIVTGLFRLGLSSLNKAEKPLVPDEGFSLRNICEMICEMFTSLGDSSMGKHNRKYLPFAITIFVYILVMNLMGLVPGMSGSTDGIPGGLMFNMGVAIIVFLAYNAMGIKEVGLVNYLKHFAGPLPLLAPLLIPIELISHLFRPITLSLRLSANMLADHAVLSSFTNVLKVVLPVAFYGLGAFVCFIQAFVFSLLTMVYIGLATAHEEH